MTANSSCRPMLLALVVLAMTITLSVGRARASSEAELLGSWVSADQQFVSFLASGAGHYDSVPVRWSLRESTLTIRSSDAHLELTVDMPTPQTLRFTDERGRATLLSRASFIGTWRSAGGIEIELLDRGVFRSEAGTGTYALQGDTLTLKQDDHETTLVVERMSKGIRVVRGNEASMLTPVEQVSGSAPETPTEPEPARAIIVDRPEALVGTWRSASGVTLRLQADGQCTLDQRPGTWHVEGTTLIIGPEPSARLAFMVDGRTLWIDFSGTEIRFTRE